VDRPIAEKKALATQPRRVLADPTRVGFVHVEAEIGAPGGSRWERLSLLVDTGAMLSVVPRPVLEAVGVTEYHRRKFRLANGDVIERAIGGMIVRFRGDATHTDVIFGEPNDQIILGVTALEQMGFLPNPVSGELEPIEMLLVGFREVSRSGEPD
jgi:predicted aspartyl protease